MNFHGIKVKKTEEPIWETKFGRKDKVAKRLRLGNIGCKNDSAVDTKLGLFYM